MLISKNVPLSTKLDRLESKRESNGNIVKKVEYVTSVTIKLLEIFTAFLENIVEDNGKEFDFHAEILECPDIDSYFAHPYYFWELESYENE